ncbi:putative oxidoreductase YjmC [subsurface metagenome]
MTTKRGTVDAEKLTNFTVRALQKVGVPDEDAQITAGMLVTTDLRGVDSHGVARLASYYIKSLKEGRINPKPRPEISSQALATAVMDGDRGLGFVVGHQAMIEAMCRAETAGAGFVSVRNSTHFGAAASYAMMAPERDMIGISMTNSIMDVVPPGSSKPGIGTNPIAIAAPAGKKPPFILDMATSVVATGKVQIAQREGTSMPEGWVIDKDENALTDPVKWVRGEGGLLPLGGTPILRSWKGFGLATVVEILSGLLSGSSAIIIKQTSPEMRASSDHFFGAFNIASFLPLENFKKSMDEMIEAFKALPTLPGVKKIYVAGDYEAEFEEYRRVNGIPLHPTVLSSLKELAEELDIEYDL